MVSYPDKKELRKFFLKKRKSLTNSFRERANLAICDNLLKIREINNIGCIAGFVSDGYEPDLTRYYQRKFGQNVQCLFPRYNKTIKKGEYELVEINDLATDLVPGAYGIKEPAPMFSSVNIAQQKDLVWLIPGVVFDRRGNRLGRGKGVYDQLLDRRNNLKIGIFYSCQQYNSVPIADHDQPLDIIVTESEIIYCKPGR